MSVIKRRMELEYEFDRLRGFDQEGKNTVLSRQFLRTLPIITNPNFSRHQIITPGYLLITTRDVLRHAVNSVFGALPFEVRTKHMMWEVELSVANPIVLASFGFSRESPENSEEDFRRPLFQGLENQSYTKDLTSVFRGFGTMHSGFAHSEFWREWYQGFLDGKPLDWELQRRVALIPDADWEKGPEHIAGIIEKIRLQFKTQTTPALVRDEKLGVFRVESDDALPRDVLEFSCTRITAAYEAAINASSENGFREDSYEASLIQRALTEFASHPSLLATSFFDACLSFQRTIGERYPEDTSLINLQNALYGVVEEINEQHEEARDRCARLAQLTQPEPISVDDMQALKEVPDMVADQVDAQAGQIIESDVERMLSTPNPPKSVRARFTNWITTISMWMDKAMKGDKRAQWLAGFIGRLVKWWSGGE